MKEKKDSSLMQFIGKTETRKQLFINKDIAPAITFELNGFDFFYDIVGLDDTTKREIDTILSDMKRLPAALGGYHGDYIGGLYDHTLLVVNYVYFLCGSLHDKSMEKNAIIAAITHDFGKVDYYGYKLDLENRKIRLDFNDVNDVRSQLTSRFNVSGKDKHVENCIAIIKKYLTNYDALFDDEMYLAIMFHHGSWSQYRPHKPNTMASLLHVADMVASQILKI
jgi:hypothetical protein